MLTSITVGDLIELLEDHDKYAMVIVSADYGDYHHTEQALPLRGKIKAVGVERCQGYSSSGYAVCQGETNDEPFLLLS